MLLFIGFLLYFLLLYVQQIVELSLQFLGIRNSIYLLVLEKHIKFGLPQKVSFLHSGFFGKHVKKSEQFFFHPDNQCNDAAAFNVLVSLAPGPNLEKSLDFVGFAFQLHDLRGPE